MAATDDIKYLSTSNTGLRVYLVTYSQINHHIAPTRWSFGARVVEAFGANKVCFYVVAKEPHEQSESAGYHYHCAVKLNQSVRWFGVKKYLKEEYNIVCNFATSASMYIGAYRYATKTDAHHFIGQVLERHPKFGMISGTYERAIAANAAFRANTLTRRNEAGSQGEQPPTKKKKTRAEQKADLGMFIVENKIRTEIELVALATKRRDNGDRHLYDFLFSMKQKDRDELVSDAWRFENAEQIMAMENVDLVDLFNEKKDAICVCNGEWAMCAQEILENNNIIMKDFAAALHRCLSKGRAKHNNIMLVGPASCGKTFLLNPLLSLVPNVFENPASSTFGWLGAEKANLLLLNDFRWKPRSQGGYIDWQELLNLLEGMKVTLPAPMNTQSKHVEITKVIPIVATSIADVHYWVRDVNEVQTERHQTETDMMNERWNVFRFSYQIPKMQQKKVQECHACFCKFLLQQ